MTIRVKSGGLNGLAGTGKIKPYSKYRNVRTVVDGITFASKKEANRYGQLKMLERSKLITDLVLQERYMLVVNDIPIRTYVADFSYTDLKTGRRVVEDVKSDGTRTEVYKIKKALMRACFGIEIVEV